MYVCMYVQDCYIWPIYLILLLHWYQGILANDTTNMGGMLWMWLSHAHLQQLISFISTPRKSNKLPHNCECYKGISSLYRLKGMSDEILLSQQLDFLHHITAADMYILYIRWKQENKTVQVHDNCKLLSFTGIWHIPETYSWVLKSDCNTEKVYI